MVIAHNQAWYQGAYRYEIQTETDDWEVVEIALSEFELYTFTGGYPTPTGTFLDEQERERIYYLELMSRLFEDGAFRLEVDYIAFD